MQKLTVVFLLILSAPSCVLSLDTGIYVQSRKQTLWNLRADGKEAEPWKGVSKPQDKKTIYFLPTGFTIQAVLRNAIFSYNTETYVTAETETDTVYLNRVVIPRGTKLHGTAGIQKTHDRVNVYFHTVVFPEGDEIKISAAAKSVDGSDGLIGKVERHKDGRIASIALKTIVAGVAAGVSASAENTAVSGAANEIAGDTIKDIQVADEKIDTSIYVESGVLVQAYLLHRIEY